MLSRRTVSTVLAAGAAATVLPRAAGAATGSGTPAIRNVVFVHGLFADGSCWSDVIARVQARGLNATAVQNPLTTLADSVAAVERVLARQDGPTVLVAHSFGGTVASEAGNHPSVAALVFVAARAPDAGEDYAALTRRFPAALATKGVVFDGDEGRLTKQAFLKDFAQDIPLAQARVLFAVQEPFRKPLVSARTTQAAWRSKPNFYAVSTADRTIDPDLQRFLAKRMAATTITLPSSHLSMISQPDAIADLVLRAANA